MNTKTIKQVDRTVCTGCGLCAVKCPKDCIRMAEDREGFLFPEIDESRCISCGLCLGVCPTTKAADKLYNKSERKYLCAIISDKDTLIKSSSGGVFGILADYILSCGGYVCGCVYNEETVAVHILTNKKEDVERMYGSKYVQSRADGCFGDIKEHLESGDTVLFTGTACQIAALGIYLGKDYDKLYCAEILCHGVPSPGLLGIYKSHLEKKLGGKVKDIRFRDKRRDGWGSEHRTCVIYEKDGKEKEYRPTLPAYFSAFFYGLNLRESCYKCRFATPERVADLTLGDFWGSYAKYKKRFTEGISVVGINTEKGGSVIEAIKQGFDFCEELTEKEAMRSNDNFEHPIKRPAERTAFYDSVYAKGYRGLWKKAYLTKTYRRKTLASVYGAFIPEKFRIWLHSLRGR